MVRCCDTRGRGQFLQALHGLPGDCAYHMGGHCVKATSRQDGQFDQLSRLGRRCAIGGRCAGRILATARERFQAAYIAKQLMSNLASFRASKQLISDGPNLFYVFPDISTLGLPTTLEQAFDEGYLVITCVDVGRYDLQIANEQYSGAFDGLALILFDWATSEGYKWAPLRRVTLPGEPQPIRQRQTASGHVVAWDEPGENF